MLDTRGLATFALVCFSLFIASVVLMPMLASGYDPVRQPISEGVLTAASAVQVAGLLALAAGSLAIAWSVVAMHPAQTLRPVVALVAFSAVCVAVLAVFPTDADGDGGATWYGRVHGVAASLAFISNAAAMLWGSRVFGDEPRLAALAGRSLVIGVITSILLVMLAVGVEPRGVVQRAAVAGVLTWMISLALSLRGLGKGVVHPRDWRSLV
jgi:hypothetical protein